MRQLGPLPWSINSFVGMIWNPQVFFFTVKLGPWVQANNNNNNNNKNNNNNNDDDDATFSFSKFISEIIFDHEFATMQ